ncbi:hypothetical protein OAP63_10690 [Vibrio sp.]|uniref:Uncharacterized protein n=1 Tax=Vibrio viridaestus TaxID=2487322 RepID=A0A3N9TBF8_9VIBR|nr:hypothetical protein [Vibrio viridaestus]MDC0611196.1 hypothetical protein [Vibrio sp.]RQW61459.1 hypothetical protein EES38_19150 [Vibrio viridaestus]
MDNNNPDQPAVNDENVFERLLVTHQVWLKQVLGLAALEAKIWAASGAQLIALICGVVFLSITAWLLLITLAAVAAWHYGFSLIAIVTTAFGLVVISTVLMMLWVRKTLKAMDINKLLDTVIPDD